MSRARRVLGGEWTPEFGSTRFIPVGNGASAVAPGLRKESREKYKLPAAGFAREGSLDLPAETTDDGRILRGQVADAVEVTGGDGLGLDEGAPHAQAARPCPEEAFRGVQVD